jgi:predicted nuclease with TOPRIM domain
MSVEFSNAYQEILFENLISIIKQNFVFQTQIKLSENLGKQRAEIQAKYDELLNKYKSVESEISQINNLKIKADQNNSAHSEKQRIQVALNEQMKVNTNLIKSLEEKEIKIEELMDYIKKLEDSVPVSKLKKIKTVPVEQSKVEPDLFQIKVNDGSSF